MEVKSGEEALSRVFEESRKARFSFPLLAYVILENYGLYFPKYIHTKIHV